MRLRPDQYNDALAILQKLSLFTGCNDAVLKALVTKLESVEFKKGKVVLMEQEISRTLYILWKGSVSIWRRVKAEKKIFATLQAPNFFGEMSMFIETPANALVKAEEDSQAYALLRADFDAIIQEYEGFLEFMQGRVEALKAERPDISRTDPKSSDPG